MEQIDIKDISGVILLTTLINEGCKRKFTLMKEDYITLKFSLDNPIYFKLGSYMECDFGLFEVCDLQKPAFNTNTAGYDYELRLDAYYWKWKNKIFKYTPETAGQEASWNLTAPLDVQAGIVLRNLKALGYTYKGQDFVFSIDSTVENKSQLMSYENINILDACFSMAKKWDCECWITENIIHFGRCEFGDAVDFEIEKNVQEMPRSESQSTYATRIYAFGSTKNIPSNYRPVDETVVVNGVVQRRLMLPEGTPYIDAYPNMTTEEAIEQVVMFDEVYPRRTGIMSDVTTKEYTETNEDTGEVTKWKAYRFKDTGITFSKDYILPGEELKITFQSGKLNGMVFAVTFFDIGETTDDDGNPNTEQLWEIVRNEDYGRPLPDEVISPENSDTYILSGWDSTKIAELGLVSAAEEELKGEAEKYVTKSKTDPNTYNCKMMSDDAYCEDGIHNLYGIGQRVNLINKAYFDNGRQSRIIGFEFNLDFPFDSPVYTVGETAAYSRIGELEEKVESLTLKGQIYTGGGGSGVYVIGSHDSTPATDHNVYSALRSLIMFMRKDREERTSFLLSLLGGTVIKKYAKFGDFVTGVSGGWIGEDARAELEALVLRSSLSVPELRFNRQTYFEGYNTISPGGGLKIKSFVANSDGSYTVTPDLEDGVPLGQKLDDILLGFWHDKSVTTGDFIGFRKVQYRITSADYDEKTFVMVPRPGYEFVPHNEMRLGQTGNFTDKERQTYIIIDVRDGNCCITLVDNANTWDPEPAQMKSWFGKKKGMTINGISCDNYSAVLQNIIMTGLIFQVDEITGQSVRVPIDYPSWESGRKYAYYSRVPHNGSTWLCVNENGTTSEPSENNPDWLVSSAKGEKGEPGISVTGGGHWELGKTPYAANTFVSFANSVFLSKVETSNPPLRILMANGGYLRKSDGGYILYNEWQVDNDWELILDGRELKGESYNFLGEFASHPAGPQNGDTYRNTTDHCVYTYKDGVWRIMLVDGTDGKDGTDYEWIYTRTNIIGLPPDKPDSKQQDDYVPEGWTDEFLGVDADHQVEWACKRVKRSGVWSEFSEPAVVHRWSKDGEPGKDGESLAPAGHWESSKTPYKANSVVSFAGGSFVNRVETFNPPYPILVVNGSYLRKSDGGYILGGTTLNSDWQVISAPVIPSASYWLDSPVSVINFTSTGTPSPSAFLVTLKQNVGGNIGDCNLFYLAARKYNGSWQSHVGATRTSQISVPATAGYTQFAVRAYKSVSDANNWNDNYIAEKGIGVVTDGKIGETGATGAFPRDRGVFASGQTYVWNADYRDKVIYLIGGVYYNFLVKNYGASVTAAPTSTNGDSNWEAMQKFVNIATDTLFADGANVAGFMFKNKVLKSRNDEGETLLINGETGYLKCKLADITGAIHATSGSFAGELKAVTGSFKKLTCIDDSGNTVGTLSFDSSGRLWFDGDMYHQGMKNGRSLRYYMSDVWVRGNFGARQRSLMVVSGETALFYPKGPSGSYVTQTLVKGTSSTGDSYYTIPCYGNTGDYAGMPVDTIVFKNITSTVYRYVLDLALTQRVVLINGNDNHNNTQIYSNGVLCTLNGGSMHCCQNISDFMLPTPASNLLGRGLLFGGSNDNDW